MAAAPQSGVSAFFVADGLLSVARSILGVVARAGETGANP